MAGKSLAVLILTLVSFSGEMSGVLSQTRPAADINSALNDAISPAEGFDVQIAPMVKAGDPTPGRWSTVSNNPWDSILARSGVIPCVSDPTAMVDADGNAKKGHDGLLQSIAISEVVNSPGTFETFGWFVKITKTYTTQTEPWGYFILMSYDPIDLPGY